MARVRDNAHHSWTADPLSFHGSISTAQLPGHRPRWWSRFSSTPSCVGSTCPSLAGGGHTHELSSGPLLPEALSPRQSPPLITSVPPQIFKSCFGSYKQSRCPGRGWCGRRRGEERAGARGPSAPQYACQESYRADNRRQEMVFLKHHAFGLTNLFL